MNRAQAAAYLVGAYGSGANNLLGQASVLAADETGGLKEPIDAAYVLLLKDYDRIGEDIIGPKTEGFIAALEYQTLTRILQGLNRARDLDVQAGQGIGLRGNQLIQKVEELRDTAAKRCLALGMTVGTSGTVKKSWGALDPALDGVGFSTDFLLDDIGE